MAHSKFLLPAIVTGPADVGRLLIELERLEEYLSQAKYKNEQLSLPKVSKSLESLAEYNKVDMLLGAARLHLVAFLESLQQHAPVIHISFASDPSAAFTIKIVEWMRINISAYTLVQVGLQPSIAAGCVIRTPNKIFDLSLGRFLRAKRHLLIEVLRQGRLAADKASAASTVVQPPMTQPKARGATV